MKPEGAPRIAAILLAAGQSRRMGGENKLLLETHGVPIVTSVAREIAKCRATYRLAVVGHQSATVRAALAAVTFDDYVENLDYAAGLGGSVRRGVLALPNDIDGALICLGDMPRVSADDLDRLIAAYEAGRNPMICVPTYSGSRGNPVLFGSVFFQEFTEIDGDQGAKHLVERHSKSVMEVAMRTDAVLRDVDTPNAYRRLIDRDG